MRIGSAGSRQFTEKIPWVLDTPPFVETLRVPDGAPAGTTTVICESESTEKDGAGTPPNVTPLVWLRLTPVTVTVVPTGPPEGLKPRAWGLTENSVDARLPLDVITLTVPLVAPFGTVAVRYVSETTLKG